MSREAQNVMGELGTFLERYLPAVEEEMRAVVSVRDSRHATLFDMLRYHLGWIDAAFEPGHLRAGKRLRPVLCLLACEGCGGASEQALPAAAAIELLHNFTLIHDDIEDRDRTRRGGPTVWSIWGEPQAINAGDTLFALSQLAMLRLQGRDVPPPTIVQATRLFNETCVALTAGQYLDIGFESRSDVTVDDYLAMIEGKTGALVACSCEIGALIAGAPDAQRENLRAFGRHSGLAFQMVDDVLGIWGDSEVTGKPVGSDIVRRKKTLPLVHGLERSADLRSVMARGAISEADVRRATDLLETEGSRNYTERLARRHHEEALAALERANPQAPAAEALRQLAHWLLARRQ